MNVKWRLWKCASYFSIETKLLVIIAPFLDTAMKVIDRQLKTTYGEARIEESDIGAEWK